MAKKNKQVTVRVLVGVDECGGTDFFNMFEKLLSKKETEKEESYARSDGYQPVWIEATFDIPEPAPAPVVKGKKL